MRKKLKGKQNALKNKTTMRKKKKTKRKEMYKRDSKSGAFENQRNPLLTRPTPSTDISTQAFRLHSHSQHTGPVHNTQFRFTTFTSQQPDQHA